MNTRERAEAFTRFVGLELKGKIVSQGFTARGVAEKTGRSASALNRWLNGKAELPLTVLCETCELIGVEPRTVVEGAYDRLVVAFGEVSGASYPAEDVAIALSEAEDLSTLDADQIKSTRHLRAVDSGATEAPAKSDVDLAARKGTPAHLPDAFDAEGVDDPGPEFGA